MDLTPSAPPAKRWIQAKLEQWYDDKAACSSRPGQSPQAAATWDDVQKYAKTTGTFWVVKEHVITPRPGSSESKSRKPVQ